MKKDFFQCDGPSGTIEFESDGDNLYIRESDENEYLIPSNALRRIGYRNHPWIFRDNGVCFRLSITWLNNGRERKRDILLLHDRQANSDLILFLKSRYPDLCFIGPNEGEKEGLLSSSRVNHYRLYALGLAATLGIISAILIIQIIFLYLSLYTSQFVMVSNAGVFYRAGEILVIFALIPLISLIMIIRKKLMVVRTDHRGLIMQKVFVRKTLMWDELEPGCVSNVTSNVYTGLFCYNSDQANVLTVSSLVEVPLRIRTGKSIVLRMPADEAGMLYRELYYRGKVSLEEAKGVKAFP